LVDPDTRDSVIDKPLSFDPRQKSGTSRVSIYGEGKKLIGVFDVEVRYDTSMLASEIARRFQRQAQSGCRQRQNSDLGRPARSPTTSDDGVRLALPLGQELTLQLPGVSVRLERLARLKRQVN
jgi:hypothetical protein